MNVDVRKSIGDAVTEVENAASGAFESGAELADQVGRQARSVGSDLEDFVRKNPVASVGGAAVIGILLGLMARTRMPR